jgi:hypothetical protein
MWNTNTGNNAYSIDFQYAEPVSPQQLYILQTDDGGHARNAFTIRATNVSGSNYVTVFTSPAYPMSQRTFNIYFTTSITALYWNVLTNVQSWQWYLHEIRFLAVSKITFPQPVTADILLVGGGGGACAGGGGAGQVLTAQRQTLQATYTLNVGMGGETCGAAASASTPMAWNGGSTFMSGTNAYALTALGGGGGEYAAYSARAHGSYSVQVASGGGAGFDYNSYSSTMQSFVTQYAGGYGSATGGMSAGGGGGAGGVGSNPSAYST